jgi:predicted XRE-type DNA-binding protein
MSFGTERQLTWRDYRRQRSKRGENCDMGMKRKSGDQDVVDGVTITRGSGNVFADLGFADSEERLAKARLARESSLRCAGMTQKEIAVRLEIDQPKVSTLVRGQLRQFSTERLMTFVRRVGQDVEIHARRP